MREATTRFDLRTTVLQLAVALSPAIAACADGGLVQGAGRFEFAADGGPPLTVWTYRPDSAREDAPVVVVMHGRGRNGEQYRDEWVEPARRHGLQIFVPEFPFDEYPEGFGYQQLGVIDQQGRPLRRERWGSTRVESLFDWLRNTGAVAADGYYFYGHSAGGQFVHRAMLVSEMRSVLLALPANAGWYTLPDLEAAFPAGLGDTGVDGVSLDRALGRTVVLLLGAGDTDLDHQSLPRNRAAVRQGPHRLARGRMFYSELVDAARNRRSPLNWSVQEISGVAHNNEDMALHAGQLIAKHHQQSLSSPSAETSLTSPFDE